MGSAAEDGHTFFFDLGDGRVIDEGQGGNSARWVNHSCAPNCETEQKGSRVHFYALRDINPRLLHFALLSLPVWRK